MVGRARNLCLRRLVAFGSFALLFLLLCPPPSYALPSYFGPSGLILTPDAHTTSFQSFSFSAHFFDFSGSLKDYGIDGSTNDFAVNYSPIPQLELGYSALDSAISSRANMFNAKLIISQQTELQPVSFAAGVIDAFDEQEITPYMLISKSLNLSGPTSRNQIGLSVNAGYGGGFYSDGFLVGGELRLTPQFSLLAEGSKKYINLGTRLHSQGLSLDLGLIDMEDFAGGISYSFHWR